MGLLRITLKNDIVLTSYMGSEPSVSPMNNAWISILKSLILGGDTIEVSDERDSTAPLYSNLSFKFNTDTAERVLPQDDTPINPLYDLDALILWLEKNPVELERLTRLINSK